MIKTVLENIQKLLKAEFVKFAIVGGISFVIEYSLLIFFVEQVAMDYLYANTLAFILTNVITYSLSRRFVFNTSSNSNKTQEAGLFALCLLGGLIVSQISMWLLVDHMSMDYRIAKLIAIAITVIWNFFTRKHFVFRNRDVATQESPTNYPSDNL